MKKSLRVSAPISPNGNAVGSPLSRAHTISQLTSRSAIAQRQCTCGHSSVRSSGTTEAFHVADVSASRRRLDGRWTLTIESQPVGQTTDRRSEGGANGHGKQRNGHLL
jgi:hypothetical protein